MERYSFLGSPTKLILAQADTLALTAEQRQQLELLELDFQRELVHLSSERQLLELEAERAKIVSGPESGLTPERRAAADAMTAKLRNACLRAQERARAILSPDQAAKVSSDNNSFPMVDLDPRFENEALLDMRIAEAVAARVKDAKVVEIETAQAIAERLLGWAKSFAILVGIPLALLAAVLSTLGITNWADFNHRVAEGKSEIDARIKTVGTDMRDLDAKTRALGTQYAELQRKLGNLSNLSDHVQSLANKVQNL